MYCVFHDNNVLNKQQVLNLQIKGFSVIFMCLIPLFDDQ